MSGRYGTSTRILAGLLFIVWFSSPTRALALEGRIVDAHSGLPVAAATVRVVSLGTAISASEEGRFRLDDLPEGELELSVTHVAYHPWRKTVRAPADLELIRLEPLVIEGQEIVVTGTRAIRGESPVAFDNVSEEKIRRTHYAQDVPMLLTESPGVYASSDNGNGIGYSYLSIRGFPQRRVSVLINGVPLNDPESHEVYWIDLPDLSENTQDIQVQRGVGTTLYGANSIGGTVNVLTHYLAPEREITLNSGFGSYGTRKFSVGFNSGLIDDRHSLYGRFSRIVSDGYREDAWTDLWSYFIAASRFDEKWTNRVNIFSGPEQTHLAYKGIPRQYLEGDTSFSYNGRTPSGDVDEDRRYNPFEWDGETDNFTQWHYQWLTEYRHDTTLRFENTLYYIKGRGYYDQLISAAPFEAFNLSPVPVLSPGGETTYVTKADQLWRRPWVENDFWGAVPRVTWKKNAAELSAGVEYNQLTADHWAEVQSVQPAPSDFIPGQRYYDYDGEKLVLSPFTQATIRISPRLALTGAMQYAFKRYEVNDNRLPNAAAQIVNHTTDYHVISPRAGLTVTPAAGLSLFGSVSYNELEPTNYEIYDATQFYVNARDFFHEYDSIAGIGSDPSMEKERLVDYEIGAALARPSWRAEINLFHMRFQDEIVYNGEVNDLGLYMRVNAPSSVHQGIEIASAADLGHGFSVNGNLSINDNHFTEFDEIYYPDTISRDGNVISGFPDHLANLRLTYSRDVFELSGHVFRAGRLYIDNSESEAASIDPYTVLNVRGTLNLQPLIGWAGVEIYTQVNNVTDEEYESSGWIDDVEPWAPIFIPAAKRNYFVGLRARL